MAVNEMNKTNRQLAAERECKHFKRVCQTNKGQREVKTVLNCYYRNYFIYFLVKEKVKGARGNKLNLIKTNFS